MSVKAEPQEEQLAAVKTEDPAPPAQQQQQLTIPDLPKEVLHRILSMATEQLSFTSRYRSLKSTALVAQAWRGPSQELLCRDAVFHSVASIQKWLEVSFPAALSQSRRSSAEPACCAARVKPALVTLPRGSRLMDATDKSTRTQRSRSWRGRLAFGG